MADDKANSTITGSFDASSSQDTKSDSELLYDTFKDAVHLMAHGYRGAIEENDLDKVEEYADTVIGTINRYRHNKECCS